MKKIKSFCYECIEKILTHHKEMHKVPEFLWPGKSTKCGIQCVIVMHAYRFEWVIAIYRSLHQSYIYIEEKKKNIEVILTQSLCLPRTAT